MFCVILTILNTVTANAANADNSDLVKNDLSPRFLTQEGKSDYVIVIAKNAPPTEQKAAVELQNHLLANI